MTTETLPPTADRFKRRGDRPLISACGAPNYQQQLAQELGVMGGSEMWQAGAATRSLRPKEAAKKITRATKGISGRKA